MARRNRDAVDMLKGLHLNVEDVGFEFPLMHHHSFVLGDLNYRLTHRDASPSEILELVENIHRSELRTNGGSGNSSGGGRAATALSDKRWSWRSGFLSDSSLLQRSAAAGSRDTRVDTETSLDMSMIERTVKGAGEDAESNASLEEFERIDDKFIWDDIFAHDELKNWMESAQVR